MDASESRAFDREELAGVPRERRAAITRAAGRVAAGIEPSALMAIRLPSADLSALPMLLEAQGVGALCGCSSLGLVSRDVATAMDDVVRRTLERGEKLAADRRAIRKAVESEGIAFAPIKGAWIADRAYVVPEARPMADTDLFVGPDYLERTTNALALLGFRASEETWKHRVLRRDSDLRVVSGVIEHPDNPRPVELHPEPREAFRGIEGRIELNATNQLAPHLEDIDDAGQAAIIAAHATVDALGRSLRLVSLVDIARLATVLPQSKWHEVIERIPQPEGARFLYPSLELAARDLGASIPRDVLATLRARILPSLARWVDRQDIDALSVQSRGQVERDLFEIFRIWPLDTVEHAAVWRFILWPDRFQLADRYPKVAASRLWPLMYGRHLAFSVAQLGRRIRMRRREPRAGRR